MIISPQNKFIFIKTTKTAGTSVEIWLSQICGEEAIITEIGSKDEEIRSQRGCKGPQNYEIPPSKYTFGDWGRLLLKGTSPPKLRNHDSIRRVQHHFPQYYDQFFSFCIERNPWDKAIFSYFFSLHHHGLSPPDLSLSGFLALKGQTLSDWRKYTNPEDEIVVDRVLRFEDLQCELQGICDRMNLSWDHMDPLLHAKSEHRKTDKPYWEFMDAEHRDRVAELCRNEIDHFGYSFEPS
jgi:hypothetical protein